MPKEIMPFAGLLTLWKLKDGIMHESCMFRDAEITPRHSQTIYSLIIDGGAYSGHIIYKCAEFKGTKTNVALIHADILCVGAIDVEPDTLFIKNAKVSQLAEYLT